MKEALRSWVRALVDALLPFSCHLCRQNSPWGSILCPSCAARLDRAVLPPFPVTDLTCGCPVFTLGWYEGILATAVKAGKYRPSAKLFRRLARLAAAACRQAWPGDRPDAVVPVPMHPEREAGRGFNQAALLGREIAAALGVGYSPALVRIRPTRPQADCDEGERATNLAGAFGLAPGLIHAAFRGRRLALVDDVATTGATVETCRQALEALQPATVFVLTLAHAPRLIPPRRDSLPPGR